MGRGRQRLTRDSAAQACYRPAMKDVDWTDCSLIETVPGKMSGAPVVRGTRVRPEDLLVNRDQGVDWLADSHGVDPEVIRRVFAFYDAHRHAPAHTP